MFYYTTLHNITVMTSALNIETKLITSLTVFDNLISTELPSFRLHLLLLHSSVNQNK